MRHGDGGGTSAEIFFFRYLSTFEVDVVEASKCVEPSTYVSSFTRGVFLMYWFTGRYLEGL